MSEDDREELRQGRHYANPILPVRRDAAITGLVGDARGKWGLAPCHSSACLQEQPEEHLGNDGKKLRPYLMQDISQKTVLCNLSSTNRFRLWCHNIAFDARFDGFILTLILISSALLAVEDPVRPDAQVEEGGC